MSDARSDAKSDSKYDVSHHILLVEDNPGDVVLIRRALAHKQPPVCLHVATDGPQALAYTRSCAEGMEPSPHLILLDLNLPKMDGCELLLHFKQDRALMSVPVVILSSSQAEIDIVRSYAHDANCYVTKPLDLEQFLAVIGAVHRYWLTAVQIAKE